MQSLNVSANSETPDAFTAWFGTLPIVRDHIQSGHIAVALSGGPDSMALLHLLARVCPSQTIIHAITVDHGLRANSADEAKQVGTWVSSLHNVHHHIVRWDGDKPDSAIMESARAARYRLLEQFCVERGIENLWVAHNRTDQAETFLFRLAKGSGLDGLAAIHEQTSSPSGSVQILRPLLDVAKDDLTAWCVDQNIPFVTDPSNQNTAFARIRLRQSMDVLAAEGLSEKRLATTARRMGRARAALDHLTDQAWAQVVTVQNDGITMDLHALATWPDDIRLRVIRRACDHVTLDRDGFGPRLDRLEEIVDTIFADHNFRAATLGGVLLRRAPGGGDRLLIAREGGKTS